MIEFKFNNLNDPQNIESTNLQPNSKISRRNFG
jgi:hypothetical protein